MFARRTATEILTGYQDRGTAITRFVQDKRIVSFSARLETPIVKQELPETGAFNSFEELFGNDLIGIDVCPVERNNRAGMCAKRFHEVRYLNSHSLTSVKCPMMAAAAAIIGLTRCVRPPRPCRPSKLRLLVEAQRSPGCKISAFIPRHIEQPASRHSKPDSRKIRSRPSVSASRFTACEPGTTIALTVLLVRYPFTTRAAALKSSRRALVQEPMKTRSISIS